MSDNMIYSGDIAGEFYAVNSTNGDLVWKYKTGREISEGSCVKDNTVYVGSYDFNFYALNALDGSFIWKYETEHAINGSPITYNNLVIFGSGNHLYTLDAENGNLIWLFETENDINNKSFADDNKVFVADYGGNFYAIEIGADIGFKENKTSKLPAKKPDIIANNPFRNSLIIEIKEKSEIYYLSGKLIARYDKGRHTINTSKWQTGTYIIKAGAETRKIVKLD
ncbi:MAG: PQQ-binding-like beta-propeller repeat protein [Candidatus Coatesbacteria bacterium]|nr:PQQ-binding-like beta-propeller repeat protein [Candidatus Coatesbacteria bacterium]